MRGSGAIWGLEFSLEGVAVLTFRGFCGLLVESHSAVASACLH